MFYADVEIRDVTSIFTRSKMMKLNLLHTFKIIFVPQLFLKIQKNKTTTTPTSSKLKLFTCEGSKTTEASATGVQHTRKVCSSE